MASSEKTDTATAAAAPSTAAAAAAASSVTTATAEGRQPPGPVANSTEVERVEVSCLMNIYYHANREGFLDTVHRWFMFGVIALGAAALIDVLPEDRSWLKPVFSAGAALLAALDLTFDLSNRARTHAMMRRRYFELLADFREGKKSPDEVRVCLEGFGADEEPSYRVLLLACWNAAQKAVFGEAAQAFNIGWLGLLCKNLFRRPGAAYAAKPITEPKSA